MTAASGYPFRPAVALYPGSEYDPPDMRSTSWEDTPWAG